MDNRVFRQKSIDRITSPEQLQDYMRVTNPGVWMVLAAVIALLAGLIISSAMATLESSIPVKAEVREGVVIAELPLSQKNNVEPGMKLRVAGKEVEIDMVFQDSSNTLIAMGEAEGLPEGRHDADIITETISPISFLLK